MIKIQGYILDFLQESNAIERECSGMAIVDAINSWNYGSKSIKKGLNIELIKNIHKKLMERVNPLIAGKIRKVPVGIGGDIKTQTHEEIIIQLNKLIDLWNNQENKDSEFIKNWHIQFEDIHPFEDGNGRTGRILMNLQRVEIGLIPLIIHQGVEQYFYYKWFEKRAKK